ncbi:putative ubiquitin carboxyl-terminal hydrolase 50 [Hydractinia symbiolongicarpus]|uniref:putative ubiquitin carboxyl-terminal hydrolase 50 n=1 Tax=Hydractinia symbiolongicarpus TaxID=13093 RepID=UPI00254D83A9|nr:putative ubiquitin carboxyl-terminal hydrolase 50 [Hydractinia symbiolongicarpus]
MSVRSTLKSPTESSMRSSFYIWLSRGSLSWINPGRNPQHTAQLIPTVLKKSFNSQATSTTSFKDTNPQGVTKSSTTLPGQESLGSNSGLHILGNACYINCILQCFYVLPAVATAISAIDSNMAMGKSLVSILRKLSSSKLDALEILEYLTPELSLAFPFFRMIKKIMDSGCTETNTYECENMRIGNFTRLGSDNFLESEELSGVNSYFCHYCNSYQTATVEKEVAECSLILVLQLKRFANNKGGVSKVCSSVTSYPGTVSIPITIDSEVSCRKHYKLRAAINHSGNLNNGHYTTVAYNEVHGAKLLVFKF